MAIPAARANSEHILRGKAVRPQIACAQFYGILRPFHRVAQRVVAAGDEPLHQRGRHIEGGRALRCIKHTEPPRSARARIEEPPAAFRFQRSGNCIHRAGNRGNLARHGFGHFSIGGVHHLEHLSRGELINALAWLVARFGQQGCERGG
jgi:hypothetical protein